MNRFSIALMMASAAYTCNVMAADNSFNPQISLILDGQYSSYDNNPEDYSIAGFQLGGEAGLADDGFSLGHSELALSSNIDSHFFGKATFAVAEHEGATEVEIEEAFIQTLGLGNGFTVTFGRFLSSFGYLNAHHQHAWDFADAPLNYDAFLGGHFADDGIQVNYILPTDMFIELSLEGFSGKAFPAGGNENGGIGASTISITLGDDINDSHSWQLGLSHYNADEISDRRSGGHSHGATTETPSFDGKSSIDALDFVYKWAPDGNPKETNFKFALEYFDRSEDGVVTMLNSGPPVESSTYVGDQKGWYASAVYQFKPQWRAGLRLDQLESQNTGADSDVLDEASLSDGAKKPKRTSVMIEWVPSEFSRVRLQYNDDQSSAQDDKQIFMQYTFSLGAHGAHQF